MSESEAKRKKIKLLRLLKTICKIIVDFELPNLLESIELSDSALKDQEQGIYECMTRQPDLLSGEESFQADEYQLIESTRETIRAWLFVACYSRFEDSLIGICRHIEKSGLYPPLPNKRDLYADKARNYLSDKVGLKFANDNNWQHLFIGYRLTRNLIVHNHGHLNSSYWNKKPRDAENLKKFIDSTPAITFKPLVEDAIQFGVISFSDAFCRDFINTQRQFLQALSFEVEAPLKIATESTEDTEKR